MSEEKSQGEAPAEMAEAGEREASGTPARSQEEKAEDAVDAKAPSCSRSRSKGRDSRSRSRSKGRDSRSRSRSRSRSDDRGRGRRGRSASSRSRSRSRRSRSRSGDGPDLRGMLNQRKAERRDDYGRVEVRERERGQGRDRSRSQDREGGPSFKGRGQNRFATVAGGRFAREHDRTRGREDGDAGPSRRNGEEAPAAAAPAAAPAAPAITRTGGVYIPPFKLAQMMAEVKDKSTPEYQRLTWDALRKSINGLVNKVNTANLKNILPEVFQENLVRGRGLLCRSLMRSQAASPSFSPVYAALVSVINTKFPEIGELLLRRLILQFRRSYRRNDKTVCSAAATFLAHLVNQGVAHELLALEVMMLLLEAPTNDSVELAVTFIKEVGAALQDLSPQGLHAVFERLRAILHEGEIEKRVQYTIEGLFAIRKAGFDKSGHPSRPEGLDLVEEGDQVTHEASLDDEIDPQTGLDVFKVDAEYEANEAKYEEVKRELLGIESGDEAGSEGGEESEEEEEEEGGGAAGAGRTVAIHDETETNVVNLRRTIYLTIMSSLDFEEAGHKLMKIKMVPGQEIEMVTMIIECCAQERTYIRYFGLLAQRFCYLNKTYAELFAECFQKQYMLVHRLETNKLRNVAKLFSHLFGTDAITWEALSCVRLTMEDTTSSARIFLKILIQDLAENLGLVKLNVRLQDPACAGWYSGIFPRDTANNVRFSINFLTSIGLGGLTQSQREYLKQLPALMAAEREKQMALIKAQQSSDSSSSSSSSSDSSSSDSSSSDSSDSDSDSDSSSSSDSSDSSDSDSSDSESDGGKRRRGSGRSSRGKKDSPRRRGSRGDGADGDRERKGAEGRGRDSTRDAAPPPPPPAPVPRISPPPPPAGRGLEEAPPPSRPRTGRSRSRSRDRGGPDRSERYTRDTREAERGDGRRSPPPPRKRSRSRSPAGRDDRRDDRSRRDDRGRPPPSPPRRERARSPDRGRERPRGGRRDSRSPDRKRPARSPSRSRSPRDSRREDRDRRR